MKVCGIVTREGERLPRGAFLPEVIRQLWDALRLMSSHGVEEFVISMDDGLSMWVAAAVIMLREKLPHIRMTCLLRWEEQADQWPESVRGPWFDIFAECDREIMLERRRSTDNLEKRDALLLEQCDCLLALECAPGPRVPLLNKATRAGVPAWEMRIGTGAG